MKTTTTNSINMRIFPIFFTKNAYKKHFFVNKELTPCRLKVNFLLTKSLLLVDKKLIPPKMKAILCYEE